MLSEKEKKSRAAAPQSSLVLVEKSTASRHKQPFRPTDMEEDAPPDLHKRSIAPAVPSVAEQLKESVHTDIKEKKESMSSETHIHVAAKKLSTTKKQASSPETIALAPMQTDAKRSIIAPIQPIPAEVSSLTSEAPDPKEAVENLDDEDSITGEITELRTPEVIRKSSEWSDDEEAGGLPRSESRASRVSRAVRQFFCCGVELGTPSEYQIPSRADGI